MLDAIHTVAPLILFAAGGGVYWLLLGRAAARRAYDRGHEAGGFDSFPEHFEKGKTSGFELGYEEGYKRGWGWCDQWHRLNPKK